MSSITHKVWALLMVVLPLPVLAQSRDTTSLQSVVITATRMPTPQSSVTQPTTVLLGDDLRARGVKTVALALREVPGAAVVQSGSYGGVTSVFMRGEKAAMLKFLSMVFR